MDKVKGICENNTDACPFWQTQELQEVDKVNPVCQFCNLPLNIDENMDNGKGEKTPVNWKRIFIILVTVLIFVCVVFGFIALNRSCDTGITQPGSEIRNIKQELPKPTPAANIIVAPTVIKKGETAKLLYSGGKGKVFKWYSGRCGGTLVGQGNNLEVTPTKTTIYYGRWEDGDKVSDCQQITVIVKEGSKPPPPPTPPVKSITYSFGKYTGYIKYSSDLRKEIPEGDGKITYTRRVQIAKHDTNSPAHYAEAGDYFDGSWGNGDIVSGYLYYKNGQIKERILAPKRFNDYDLSKD